MNQMEIDQTLMVALVSVAVVATILAVSRNQVLGLIRQGKLEAINVGLASKPTYRVKTESVRKILEGAS